MSLEHVGSAHTDDELAVLVQVAEERRQAGQLALDLDDVGGPAVGSAAVVVEGTSSLILWEVLSGLYDDLGLDRLGDGAFRALVLARVIEPTSKADSVRVLTEIGVVSPHRVTFMRCLKRVIERDYRSVIAQACHRHATRDVDLAVVLYDVTTLLCRCRHNRAWGYSADRTSADQRCARDALLAGGPGSAGCRRLQAGWA